MRPYVMESITLAWVQLGASVAVVSERLMTTSA